MSLEILVTTSEDEQSALVLPDGTRLLETLARQDEKMAIRIQELLSSVFSEVRRTVDVECSVEVSIAGKVSLKGEGSVRYLIFNVGAEAASETTMTIKLSATISPSK